ncbi:MAG: hypothetical protein L6R38_000025 [Xanthoria sp. 2 TBL-2021]|nr:MAG: hypothetical protein L6R38_000025 [Xanthoria sp. 2 TBL-2021]
MAWFSGPGSPTPSRHSTSYRRSSSYSQHGGSSSYYKRRPRDGYIQRMVHEIKKMLRNLVSYARRHPLKVFMLVIMPLITGGALHNILRQFGIRLPAGLSSLVGGYGGGRAGYDSMSNFSGGGGDGGIQSAMKIAKMFM